MGSRPDRIDHSQRNMMKNHIRLFKLAFILFFSLTLHLILFVTSPFWQYFTINQFHSDIMIDQDASVIVKETIDVEYYESRHGIYREVPFEYRDDLGNVLTTPIRVLSVRDESEKPWKYRVTKAGQVINIKIGDANRYVEGHQTYVITYEIENAILYFKDHDELYWNVTGNFWKAPIEEASATVYLLTQEKSKGLMLAGFEGIQGSKEECGYETYGELGRFYTKRSLSAGEGMTIAFGWDKGIVSPPVFMEEVLVGDRPQRELDFFAPCFILRLYVRLLVSKGKGSKSKGIDHRDV
jgi:Predicted membrane protein (DUF2207) N-terminal domain